MKQIHFNIINSTNQYLKENYKKLEHLTIVTADHQTNGRGRFNRKWEDKDDLLFSILIKENLNTPIDYSLVIAKTVLTVLNNYLGNLSIKWPNDIMVGDRKICGILLEGVTTSKIECVIIGVGININTKEFSDGLLIKATSIYNEIAKEINKLDLLNEIKEEFLNDYYDYIKGNKDYLNIINNNFYLRNKKVTFTYNNKLLNGKVIGLNENGKLIINKDGELIEISSGEVTLTNVYKS